jgi:hypothetical protein
MFMRKTLSLPHLSQATIISLGQHCMISHQLRRHQLLKEHFGFEWIKSLYFASYIQLFKNNFADVFAPNNLQQLPEANFVAVKDTFYNLLSVHDYKNQQHFIDEPQFLYEQYKRRMARIDNALLGNKKIVFIRYHTEPINEQELLDFTHLIKSNYPKLKFFLCLVIPPNLYSNLPKIKEISYFRYQHTLRYKIINRIRYKLNPKATKAQAWKGDDWAWNKIFAQINKKANEH